MINFFIHFIYSYTYWFFIYNTKNLWKPSSIIWIIPWMYINTSYIINYFFRKYLFAMQRDN